FHGPQSRALKNGENSANYVNAEYDQLFERVRAMDNGPERQALIDRMIEMLRFDAPWAWGLHPQDFTLAHSWVYNRKPNKMANNNLKYQRIDPQLRETARAKWNSPVLWPLLAALAALVLVLIPAVLSYRRRERAGGKLAAV
ncbi:MAG TPA: peptide ABC transporter substrate-binding protein, partial [Burkholderiales bacterium]|nr:peptide ABC transporter substrate-binding protein [Burkholderiales bacterium]